MNPKNDRTPSEARPAPVPRKRFRVEKLEERVAPKRGGKGTHNTCGTDGCGGSTSSGLSGSIGPF